MATITLTITTDGTEAELGSGDCATVVFDRGSDALSWTVLDRLSCHLRLTGWQRAFEYAKEIEQEQAAAAETGQ